MKKKIDYDTQQLKWAYEIMKEKNIDIMGINWNKFRTKEEIEQVIDNFIKTLKKLRDSDD